MVTTGTYGEYVRRGGQWRCQHGAWHKPEVRKCPDCGRTRKQSGETERKEKGQAIERIRKKLRQR